MSGINTTQFQDPYVRAAAQVVDKHLGKKNNKEITQEDLLQAQQIVEQLGVGVTDAVEGWHPDEVSILRRKLPDLWKAFNAAESPPPKKAPDKYDNILVDTLVNSTVRETARVLATRKSPERHEVSITDIIHARAYFKAKREGRADTFGDQAIAKKIEDGIKAGKFNMEAFDLLAVFMSAGHGDLASHRPMKIGGRMFNEVYWLPRDILDDSKEEKKTEHRGAARHVDHEDGEEAALESTPARGAARPRPGGHTGATPPADDGDDDAADGADGDDHAPAPDQGTADPDRRPRPAEPPRSRSDTELLRIIEAYEAKFDRTNLDRVYVKGPDGQLYVAINRKGPVDDLNEGDKATMYDTDREFGVSVDSLNVSDKGSGTVMKVIEANNSIGDATVGFWGKLLGKLGSTIRNLLTRRVDQRLEATAGRVTTATRDRMTRAEQDNMRNMLVSGGAVATMGAAIASAGAALGQFPLVAGAVAGTGVVLTAVNVVDYLIKNPSVAAIEAASGLNRGTPD